jgi:putative endonuclease
VAGSGLTRHEIGELAGLVAKNMACIYVLKSELNGKLYVGSSREDVPEMRLVSHNAGRVKSTKSVRPWGIIHVERYDSYSIARRRELYLKSGRGREIVKQIVS